MTVIYVDQVFCFNMLLDGLLLYTTARLGGFPLSWKRLLLSALLGGVYGVLAAVWPGAGSWAGQLLTGFFLSALAFWGQRHLLRQQLLFWLVSCAYGGMVLAAAQLFTGESSPSPAVLFGTLPLSALLCGGVFARFALHGGSEGSLRRITLQRQGKRVSFTALYDSGNTLTQPGSGQPLLVVDERVLQPLWEEPLRQLLSREGLRRPEQTYLRLKAAGRGEEVSLCYCRTACSRRSGLLLMRVDWLEVGHRRYLRPWIGLSPCSLSDGGGYWALWGGKELENGVADQVAGALRAFSAGKADVHRRQRRAAAAAAAAAGAAGSGTAGAAGPGGPAAAH